MFDYGNPMYNPTLMPYLAQPQPQAQQHLQRQEVPKCNGKDGALSFNLAPNSSVLILDSSGKIVWAVTSDGLGNKTASPFDIFPHEEAPAPDLTDIVSRIETLERMMEDAKHSGISEPKQSGSTANYTAYSADKADDKHDQKRK